jgi:hypothetical protein
MEIFISGNTPSSKNNKVWTGKFLVWSKSAQKYKKETKKQWEEFRDGFVIDFTSRKLPVAVSFKFIRGTKHKFDYVNPLQTVLDLMVEYEWIEDDNSDVILPSFEQYEYNKEKPGVWIKVL